MVPGLRTALLLARRSLMTLGSRLSLGLGRRLGLLDGTHIVEGAMLDSKMNRKRSSLIDDAAPKVFLPPSDEAVRRTRKA